MAELSTAAPQTWLSRVQLLDDLPIGGEGSDILGLEPLARSLAESLIAGGGKPMIIHVDGGWGRGKTSFCHSVKRRLDAFEPTSPFDDVQKIGVSWYVASDAESNGHDAILYQVLRAAVGDDLEEIGSLLARFAPEAGAGSAEPQFERFRSWLYNELGWAPAQTGPVRITLDSGPGLAEGGPGFADAGPGLAEPDSPAEGEGARGPLFTTPAAARVLEMPRRAKPRKLAVVFVDDLDRCSPASVSQLLDTIRRYVTCHGVAFVIAADRQVIAAAFETVVRQLGVEGRLSGAEALEKYVRHSVKVPRWGLDADQKFGNALRALQRGLDKRRELLPLLQAPTPDLRAGIAFKLVIYLPQSLSIRRLKRVLNRFVLSLARYADLAGIRPSDLLVDHVALSEPSSSVWQKMSEVVPRYGDLEARRELYPAYFFGQLVQVTLEEVWPELLADLPLDSAPFRDRILALATLGTGLRTRVGNADFALSLELFARLLGGMLPASSSKGSDLTVQREVCEFLASVFAELGRSGFEARPVPFFIDEPAAPTVTAPAPAAVAPPAPAPAPAAEPPASFSPPAGDPVPARGRPEPTLEQLPAAASAGEAASAEPVLDQHALAGQLRALLDLAREGSALNSFALAALLESLSWLEERRGGAARRLAPELQEALRAWADWAWPGEAALFTIDLAHHLLALGMPADAFNLLAQAHAAMEFPVHSGAFRWALAEQLIQLAHDNVPWRRRLGRIPNFPPRESPDCASAWRAAVLLIGMQPSADYAVVLDATFVERIVEPLGALVAHLPGLDWPARILLSLVREADQRFLPIVRSIAERLLAEPLPPRRRDIALGAIRVLRAGSSDDQRIALRLYKSLEASGGIPRAELGSAGLLSSKVADLEAAANFWEQGYRLGSLNAEMQREFLIFLEGVSDRGRAERVARGEPLPDDEHASDGALPSVAEQAEPELSLFELNQDVDKVAPLLESLRSLPGIDFLGPVTELACRLLMAATAKDHAELAFEARAWSEPDAPSGALHLGSPRASAELARALSKAEFEAEGRRLIGTVVQLQVLPDVFSAQLWWLLLATEVELVKGAQGNRQYARLQALKEFPYFLEGDWRQPPLFERGWQAGAVLALPSRQGSVTNPVLLGWRTASSRLPPDLAEAPGVLRALRQLVPPDAASPRADLLDWLPSTSPFGLPALVAVLAEKGLLTARECGEMAAGIAISHPFAAVLPRLWATAAQANLLPLWAENFSEWAKATHLHEGALESLYQHNPPGGSRSDGPPPPWRAPFLPFPVRPEPSNG